MASHRVFLQLGGRQGHSCPAVYLQLQPRSSQRARPSPLDYSGAWLFSASYSALASGLLIWKLTGGMRTMMRVTSPTMKMTHKAGLYIRPRYSLASSDLALALASVCEKRGSLVFLGHRGYSGSRGENGQLGISSSR